MANKRNREGIVFSTDPEFDRLFSGEAEAESPSPSDQTLLISLDRKHRKGKVVTLIEGFTGSSTDLSELERVLKKKAGVGGSSTDGCIILQGDLKKQVGEMLGKMGYGVKFKG